MLAKQRIGELLVEKGVISREHLEKALRLQQWSNRLLGQILIGKGWGSEFEIYKALAQLLHVEFVSFENLQVDPHIIQLVPELLAVTRDIFPLAVEDNTLYLVMENPRDLDAIQIVEFTTERQVRPLIAPLSQLREIIRRYYCITVGTGKPAGTGERPKDLDGLGFSADHLTRYRQSLQQPQGLILVTGPPGSGKTTTLYAALNAFKQDITRTLVTIEDPIAEPLSGVKQIQVDFKAGLTFATILSLIHDQYSGDNAVIFVGELGDADTAHIVMRVAETGHLVLSSLYAPDALGAVQHLYNLDLPPEVIAANLRLVLAERQVRAICPTCKEQYSPDEQELRSIGVRAEQQSILVGYRGAGCSACHGTGYRGQIGIYELFEPDERLRAEIARRPAQHALKQLAIAAGMKTLLADGLDKVWQGRTTIAEVARVCCAHCPGCGKAFPETENICPACQYRLAEMCTQCGARVDIAWRWCPFCGARKASAP